ncbi:MAG TPA: SCO family protein [Pyrinomonadaceae bacterium]|jgi:protein SCO1/2
MNPDLRLPMRLTSYLLLGLVCLLAAMSSLACRQTQKAASGRRYELNGKVVSVDRAKHRVTLDHEEIPGYMEAMIMPYTLRDEQILAELVPGDQLRATLVVDGNTTSLENIMFTRSTPESSGANAPVARAGPKPGDALPDFKLVNQDAKAIALSQYRGKALVLTFIYTRCPLPEYCTLMSTNFAAVDRELQKNPELYARTHLLSVSFDPGYDTPKVLRSYGAAHTGNFTNETFKHWEFATGKPEEIKEMAQFFGLTYYQETDQIIHGLRTAIITPDGHIHKIYEGNEWKPEELLRELQTLFNKG